MFSRAAVALHGSRSARHNHSDSISRRTADEARSASWESKQSSAAASIVATRYAGQPVLRPGIGLSAGMRTIESWIESPIIDDDREDT